MDLCDGIRPRAAIGLLPCMPSQSCGRWRRKTREKPVAG